MKKLIVYDLDGTLAESKSSLDTEMATLLHDLLGIVKETPGESIHSSYMWNKVLSIHKGLEKDLFRRFHG